MANGSMTPFSVPLLTKDNYHNWSVRMKTLIGCYDAWEVVERGIGEYGDEENLTNSSSKREKKIIIFLWSLSIPYAFFIKMNIPDISTTTSTFKCFMPISSTRITLDL
ncbi:hypothetical protein PRUPE_7G019700 [Prunus persica]|uniref:DUF4219 domain-containing protein n=1 Tax=Prunus persica TaxID=3760 RepID=A0A251N595_PRUPE|nr:hypothetical protein PRUPE_7G019700 [Prunus persica]